MTEPMPMPPPVTQQEKAPKIKSKGEKLFDFFVYGPMNYVGTFLLTMPLAYAIKYGRLSAWYDSIDRAIGSVKIAGVGLHEGKFTGKVVKALQSTFITFWGGNAMLGAIRVAESEKLPIVSKLNTWTGDPTDPQTIKDEPQQTWGTLIKGRCVAFCMTFGIMLTGDTVLHHHFDRFQKATGEFFKKNFTRIQPQKAFHYGEIAALDIFATAAASALLYVSSKFFAQKRDEKIEFREFKAAHPDLALHRTRAPMRAGDIANDNSQEVNDNAPATEIGSMRQREGMVASMPEREVASAH